MVAQKLQITRDELATFLKNHEQIKQFEKLFQVVDTVAPDVVNGVNFAADTAQTNANLALVKIAALAAELAVDGSVADAKATQALNKVQALSADFESSAASLETKINQAFSVLSQVSSAINALEMAPTKTPTKQPQLASFVDTTTQVAGAVNTPQAITFNTTDLSEGVFLRSSSEIVVTADGVYDLQFSIQLDKTSGGTANFWIWPRVNGVDVSNSASQIHVQGNNAEVFSAANFFFGLKAGDYVQLMFAVSDVSVQLQYFAASAFVPAIPSIIVTMSTVRT